ncbi:MAG TPA: hypothetical protein VF230_05150 [Acidimicrobiales bacterium]
MPGKLRVLSTETEHHYHRALYDPIGADVAVERFRRRLVLDDDPRPLRAALEGCDVFHVHWPEWLLGPDVERNQRLIDELRAAGAAIVWTQHNLLPHDGDTSVAPVYALWARHADAVLHHSDWGRDRVTATYPFRPGAMHVLVPHPHFGHLAGADGVRPARGVVERELGLRAGALRLGVVGAPRRDKDVGLVMRAVARCHRDDVELAVFSLADGDEPVDDLRIRAWRYRMVPREEYERQLAVLDVLVLPFRTGDMLTTGTVGDAIAHGLPSLVSGWPFLTEVLGEGAIPYGETEDDLARTIDGLGRSTLARAGEAAAALRPVHAAPAVAARLLEVLRAVTRARP